MAGRPQTSGPPPASGLTSGEGDTRRQDDPSAAEAALTRGRGPRPEVWASRGVVLCTSSRACPLPLQPLGSPVGQTPEGPPSKTWVGLQLLTVSVAPRVKASLFRLGWDMLGVGEGDGPPTAQLTPRPSTQIKQQNPSVDAQPQLTSPL